MALDRILSRKRSEIERLHLNKLGQLNYYYRDEYGVFYEVAEDRRILRVSKLLNDWMTSIVDEGSATTVIENIFGELMPYGTTSQYWRGDKTWADFSTTVLSTTLTGFVVGTNTSITSSDSVLTAFQNTQAQIDAIVASLSGYVPTSRQLTINGVTWDLSADRTWNVGTVTSVDLTMPAIFSVAGNPITTSGTFAVTLATQTANTVFAGPTAGIPATPTFRSLVAADIPSLSGSYWAQGGNAFGATGVLGTTDTEALIFITNNTEKARILSTGEFIVGDTTTTVTGEMNRTRTDHNAATWVSAINNISGAAAKSGFLASTSSTGSPNITMQALSVGFVTSGMREASTGIIQSNFTNGLNIGTNGASSFKIWTNDLERVEVTSGGFFGIGMTPTVLFEAVLTQNAATTARLLNANASGAARALFQTSNGTSVFNFEMLGTGFTTAGGRVANQGNLLCNGVNGILIGANNVAATEIGFYLRGTATTNKVLSLTNTSITVSDAINFVFNTTTGTKLGTATSQKIGVWNATPIVQPTTAVAGATLVFNLGTPLTDTDTFDGYTVAQVVKALRNIGLLA